MIIKFLITNLTRKAVAKYQDTIVNGTWNTPLPSSIASQNHAEATATFSGPDSSATVVYKPNNVHLLTASVMMRNNQPPTVVVNGSQGYRVTGAVIPLNQPNQYQVSVTFHEL
jgi:hypothetical protein